MAAEGADDADDTGGNGGSGVDVDDDVETYITPDPFENLLILKSKLTSPLVFPCIISSTLTSCPVFP